MKIETRTIQPTSPTQWQNYTHSCGGNEFINNGRHDHHLCFYWHITCIKCKKEIYWHDGVGEGEWDTARFR